MKISGAMQQVPSTDLREAERMNAFFIVPASVKGSLKSLFATHPPMEKRIERLQQLEAQLQRPGRRGLAGLGFLELDLRGQAQARRRPRRTGCSR